MTSPFSSSSISGLWFAALLSLVLASSSLAQIWSFGTVAGNAGYGSSDGTNNSARFNFPQGIASDASANLYLADTHNSTIRKITPAGVVSTLAGSAGQSGSRDGPGYVASFNLPQGIAADGAGNVYVADTANSTIRKITPSGYVSTLAGSPGFAGSSNGVNGSAMFNLPAALCTDLASNIYVADTYNHTIRKIAPAGSNWVVTTLAGTAGIQGFADGTNGFASFHLPSGIAVGSNSTLYVADTGNNSIRRIAPLGTNWVTTTIALVATPRGITLGQSNALYVTDLGSNIIHAISFTGSNWIVTKVAGVAGSAGSTDGNVNAAQFNSPCSISTAGGSLFVADSLNNTIRQIVSNSVVNTFAGLAGGPGYVDGSQSAARFSAPSGVALDSIRNVYVADAQNNAIRLMTPGGTVTTLAGLPGGVAGHQNGIGTNAAFDLPAAVTVDAQSNVVVADFNNNEVRKLHFTGSNWTSSALTVATNWTVNTLAGRAGVVYFASITNEIADFGDTSSLTGFTSLFRNYSDILTNITGVATNYLVIVTNIPFLTFSPIFTNYSGLATNTAAGMTNYWIAVTNTPLLTNLVNGKTVTNHLATNVFNLPTDPAPYRDGIGTNALFYHPTGIAADAAGNVYVADGDGHGVRVIAPDASVTTLTGSVGTYSVSPDIFGTNLLVYQSSGMALDSAGRVYISDQMNNTIRQITPAGLVTTIAGSPGFYGTDDGTNSNALFAAPLGLAVDTLTNLFVTDSVNNTIRRISPQGSDWVVTTIGGAAGVTGSADGFGSTALFNNPGGIAVDSQTNIFVADTGNNTIRLGSEMAVPPATLHISLVSGQVVLIWSSPPAVWKLESTTNLAPTAIWSLVAANPIAIGTNLVVTNALTAQSAFYRLHAH